MKKGTKKVWLIVGIITLIVLIGVGLYFLFKGSKKNNVDSAIDEAYQAALNGTPPTTASGIPAPPTPLNYNKSLVRGGTAQREETRKLQTWLNWALQNPQSTPAGMMASLSPIGIAGFKATANNVIKAASASAVAYDSQGVNKFQLAVDGVFGPVTEATLKAFTGEKQMSLTQADQKLGVPDSLA